MAPALPRSVAARARRRPGRPSARSHPRDVRQALLLAASRSFAERGFEAVSLRDIARAARTTPAMIHYYFGDKHGLYAALLERALAGLLERVRSRLAAAPPGVQLGIDVFLEAATAALGEEPWLPQLVLREVLSGSAPFRDRFIESYARPMSQLLCGVLEGEIAAGRMRADLEPRLAVLSLLGMAGFPFLARPVIERVLDLSFDGEFPARLAAHTRRMFRDGARP
jgi:AcrR family transcriptional regulator